MPDVKWVQMTWGDVISLQRGYDITKAQQVLTGTVPVVSSGGVASFHDEAIADGPGVVIGRKGSLGSVHWVDGPYWPHDTTLWVRDFKGNDPRFVYYALKTLRIDYMNVGSASPTLNRNHVHPMPVRWPDSQRYQRGIAEVLGALDDKIAANRDVLASANELAIATVAQAVGRVPLSDLAEFRRATIKPEDFGADPVVHLSLPAFDSDQTMESTDPIEIKSAKFAVTAPAVLMSKLNPRFPRIWDIPVLPAEPVLVSTEFVVLEPKTVATSLLAAAVAQPALSRELEGRVSGTSGSHQRVKPSDIMESQVADVRGLSTKHRDLVTSLGQQCAQSRRESRDLAATRDALLPLLISGKLRVKDAEKTVGELV